MQKSLNIIKKKTITAIGKAKVIDLINKIDLTSEKVTYYQLKNFLIAEKNVKIFDKINEVELITNKIEYYLNQKEINTFKNTSVKFKKKYNFQGKNLSYNIIKKNYLQIKALLFQMIKII